MWALDCCFGETAEVRRIKLLDVGDEFTREAWPLRPPTVSTLTASSAPFSASSPTGESPSNGPEARPGRAAVLVPHLGHPHRLHRARIVLETPFIESFNGQLGDECFNTEDKAAILEA